MEKLLSNPCVIREILYAPNAPTDKIKELLEIALIHQCSSRYQMATQSFLKAQHAWLKHYLKKDSNSEADSETNYSEFGNKKKKIPSVMKKMKNGDPEADENQGEEKEGEGGEEGEPSSDEEEEEDGEEDGDMDIDEVKFDKDLMAKDVLKPEELIFFRLAIGSVYESCANDSHALLEYKEAERYAEKLFSEGPHILKATIYSFLGSVSHHQDQSQQAITYFEKSYEMRKELLGDDHVDTAILLNNIAVCKHSRLLSQYRKNQILGLKRTNPIKDILQSGRTATTSSSASSFAAQAAALVAALGKAPTPGAPASSTNPVPTVVQTFLGSGSTGGISQEELEEAMALYKKTRALLEKKLGADHPRTQIVIQNLEKSKNLHDSWSFPMPPAQNFLAQSFPGIFEEKKEKKGKKKKGGKKGGKKKKK